MKKVFYLIFVFLVFSVTLLPGKVGAQTERRSIKVATVPTGTVVDENFVIKAGESVEISGEVNGEVIVAGGEVLVDGKINGDLLVAGGTVMISGEVTQDLRVAGGQVTIIGTVGGNVTVAGGNVEITQSAKLGGGVVTFAGNTLLSSVVPGDVHIFGGSLTLASDVRGSINAFVENLRVKSSAKVGGDINYTSENEASIDPGASISGKLVRSPLPVSLRSQNLSSSRQFFRGFGLQVKLFSFVIAFYMGLLLLRFLPNFTLNVSKIGGERPLKSVLYGFTSLIITPFIIFVFLITIVGIPLGLILIFSYILSLYLAKIYVSYWLGRTLFGKEVANRRYLPYGLGLITLYAISFIPFFGGLISFIALILGFGAAIFGSLELYQKALKVKVI